MRSHMKETIEDIVQKAIENKPQGCTNIRIIDKSEYVGSDNPFMRTGHYVKRTYARYNINKGQIDVKISNGGNWMYTEPANHILQAMGEYHPFSKENYRQNRNRYESQLDDGMINEPINGLTSPKWKIKQICEEIIAKSINNIEFILWFDESELNKDKFDTTDHWYYSDDLKIKEYFCARITIKYGGETHTTRGGFYSRYFSWINRCANALENHKINYTVDITDKDYQKWCKLHNWNDLEFNDQRFNL